MTSAFDADAVGFFIFPEVLSMKSNIRNSILPTAALCGLAIAAGIVTGALTAGFGRILLWIGTFRSNHLLWACRFCRLPAF